MDSRTALAFFTEYASIRGGAALTDAKAVVIETADQPCTKFNLIAELSRVKEMYDQGNALFFANMGHLDVPVTTENWEVTRAQLFSHFHMEAEQEYVDAFREALNTGVLGRLLDVLQGKNYTVTASGINGDSKSLSGDAELGRFPDVIHWSGLDEFYPKAVSSTFDKEAMKNLFINLNNRTKVESGLFAEHWSHSFVNAIDRNENLEAALDTVTLSRSYSGSSKTATRLSMAAKIIRSRDQRQVNRDAIYFTIGGHDTHAEMVEKVTENMADLNSGLDSFTRELEDMGLTNNVTIMVISEFGRTLTLNGGEGTDHAWGGNYFILGGAVAGGKMVGQYPPNFSENDPTSCGRGRLIPSTPWEAMWNGVAQWFGVTDEAELGTVLPNRDSFPSSMLFSKNDLFSVD